MSLRWITNGVSHELQDDNHFLEVVRGRNELPELRAQDRMLPFRHGRLPAIPFADGRLIEARGWVDVPYASFRAEVDPLKQALAPFTTGVLVDELEDGTLRWANARVSNLMWIHLKAGTERVSVEFVAHDPFWYSAYGALDLDSGVEMDDDELMDAGGEIVVVPFATEVTFTNPGNTDVERIRVRFIGPAGGGVGIENLSTPELVGFTSTNNLSPGERVTVNNYHRTAHLDTGIGTPTTNVRGTMTPHVGNQRAEYLRIVPGSNTLRVLGSPAEARILFFPTWL